jgi:hypothetical protein
MLQTRKATYIWALRILNLGLLFAAITIGSTFCTGGSAPGPRTPAKLVQEVRESTRQFLDVNNAGPAGYERHLAVSVVQTTARWEFTTSMATWWAMEKLMSRVPKP